MTIRERWIAVVHKAATGSKKTRTLLTPLGVALFASVAALVVLVAIVVDSLLGLPEILPTTLQWVMAVLLLTTGGVLTIWSALHFLRVRGTPVPFNPPPDLVDTGPYRYVRNPMLTGVFLVLFGLGAAVDSVSLLVVFAPLFVALNYWELKHIEEPELVLRLGDTYIRYREKTPMFIPRRTHCHGS